MAALTSQFKIKCDLEQREFAKVVYANFFEVGISAKHKMPHVEESRLLQKRLSE